MASMDAEQELTEFGRPLKTEFAQLDTPLNREQMNSLPTGNDSQHDRDVHTLARLGKRQVLKVRPPRVTARRDLVLSNV